MEGVPKLDEEISGMVLHLSFLFQCVDKFING
jgi:hypothetical protein